MKNKIALKLYLGLAFLAIGGWKLYEKYIAGEELPTIQLVGSFFLVGLGLYRCLEYFKNKSDQSPS